MKCFSEAFHSVYGYRKSLPRGKLRSVIFFLAAYMPPLRIRAERKGEENVAYCAGDLREHMDVLAKTDSADGRGFPVQA